MSIYNTHKPNTNKDYLKLKDGDKIKLRIFSEPAISTYDGKKLKYSWIVVNRETGAVQVYQAGVSVFSQIADLVDEWGDPTEFDISIKRKGSTQFDTEYTVNPVKDSGKSTKEQEEVADKLDLIEAIQGKWLADYEEDGIMPPTIQKSDERVPATIEDALTDKDLPPEMR